MCCSALSFKKKHITSTRTHIIYTIWLEIQIFDATYFLHVFLERWMIYELCFTISENEWAFHNDSLWLYIYLLKPNPNSWVNMRLVTNEVIHRENTKKLPPPKWKSITSWVLIECRAHIQLNFDFMDDSIKIYIVAVLYK